MNSMLTGGPPVAWTPRLYGLKLPANQWISIWPQNWVDGELLKTSRKKKAPTHARLFILGWTPFAHVGTPSVLEMRTGSKESPIVRIALEKGTRSVKSTQHLASISEVSMRVGAPLLIRTTYGAELQILAQHANLELWSRFMDRAQRLLSMMGVR